MNLIARTCFFSLAIMLSAFSLVTQEQLSHWNNSTRLAISPRSSFKNAEDVKNESDSAAKVYQERALSVFRLIMDRYAVPGTDFLTENYPAKPEDKKVAYMWSLSGMVTAAGLLQQLEIKDPAFAKITNAIDQYWSRKNGLHGVEAYPPLFGGDKRFYDDNATIGLDYLENYKATGNEHFLNQAKKCFEFDVTGESADCGGGIFWNEDEKSPDSENYIKATCSTSFSMTLALKLYMITRDPKYLAFGKRLYDWAKTNLQDPNDLVYWNDIGIRGCVPNKTKWTYNSGAMLTNAVLFYEITNDNKYLKDATELAAAAFKFFTEPSDKTGRRLPDHDPWFTTVLFRGYLDLYRIDADKNTGYIDTFIENVDYAWKNARTPDGFFYEDWTGKKQGRYHWLLNQACMVEMYSRIALYKEQLQKQKL